MVTAPVDVLATEGVVGENSATLLGDLGLGEGAGSQVVEAMEVSGLEDEGDLSLPPTSS